MTLSTDIRTAALQSAANIPIPSLLRKVVGYFETVHVIYRNIKFAILLKKPSSSETHPFLIGSILQLAAPLTNVTEQALKFCLIAKCVNDVLECYQALSMAYTDLVDICTERYPILSRKELLASQDNSFWHGYRIRKLLAIPSWLLRIISAIVNLCAKIFTLSMTLQDVKLLTLGDEAQKNMACTQLIAQWQAYRLKLTDSKLTDSKFLKQETGAQSRLIGTLMQLAPGGKASELLSKLQDYFEQIKQTSFMCEVKDAVEETTNELWGNGGTGFFINYTPSVTDQRIYTSDRHPIWAGHPISRQRDEMTK